MACWLFYACRVLMCVLITNELTVYAGVFFFFLPTLFYSLATASLLKPSAKTLLYLIFSFPPPQICLLSKRLLLSLCEILAP